MKPLQLIRLLFACIATLSAAETVLDFEKEDGRFTLTANARLAGEGALSGRSSLVCDTREASGLWNHCLTTTAGLFKPGATYTISFRYRNVELGPDSFLHVVVRDPAVGDRSTLASVNLPDTNGVKTRRVRVQINDSTNYSILFFVKNKGVALVDDLTVTEGDGLGVALATAEPARTTLGPSSLPPGPGAFSIERPRGHAGPSLNVGDFGASTSLADNHAAFSNALEACRVRKASRLVIPPGKWRFDSFDTLLLFYGVTNLTVEGRGAELVFYRTRPKGGNPFIRVEQCERVAFDGLAIDWDWQRAPLASIVRVEAVSPDGAFLDCRFTEYERVPNPKSQVRVMEAFDAKLGLVGYEGSRDLWEGSAEEEIEWLGPNLGRFHAAKKKAGSRSQIQGVQAGQYFRVRHYNYDQGGFHIYDSTHLLFTNVTVYSCPGMAFIVKGESHHQEWNGVKITPRMALTSTQAQEAPTGVRQVPRPGEPRSITCTADHFHVNNSLGWLKFEKCQFTYGGDDCINIHDNNFHAVPKGPSLLEGRFFRAWATPVAVGDPLEIRNEDLSPTGFTARVQSISVDAPKQTAQIALDRPLPATLGELVVCFNRRFGSHHYIIRNSTFGKNRAAGFRLQADHGLVEGNLFYHHQMPGIRLETGWATYGWSEGYGVSNLVIRNNTFINCNPVKNEEHGPVIHMGVFRRTVSSPDNKSAHPVFTKLLIESNAFVNCAGVAITVSSAGDITIRSNAFYGEKPRQSPDTNRSSVFVSFASNVNVLENLWRKSPHVPRPGVVWDPATGPAPTFSGNRLE